MSKGRVLGSDECHDKTSLSSLLPVKMLSQNSACVFVIANRNSLRSKLAIIFTFVSPSLLPSPWIHYLALILSISDFIVLPFFFIFVSSFRKKAKANRKPIISIRERLKVETQRGRGRMSKVG